MIERPVGLKIRMNPSIDTSDFGGLPFGTFLCCTWERVPYEGYPHPRIVIFPEVIKTAKHIRFRRLMWRVHLDIILIHEIMHYFQYLRGRIRRSSSGCWTADEVQLLRNEKWPHRVSIILTLLTGSKIPWIWWDYAQWREVVPKWFRKSVSQYN